MTVHNNHEPAAWESDRLADEARNHDVTVRGLVFMVVFFGISSAAIGARQLIERARSIVSQRSIERTARKRRIDS